MLQHSTSLIDRGATSGPDEQHSGGSGLQGSPKSFMRILRAIFCRGEVDGVQILKEETVKDMLCSHLSQDTAARKQQLDSSLGADRVCRGAGSLGL